MPEFFLFSVKYPENLYSYRSLLESLYTSEKEFIVLDC